MKFLKKELRLMEEIEEDTVNWQHSTTIPLFPNLKIRKKERTIENWKHEVYLWEEDKYIHFSSGAKMFLYICALLHDNDRSKMLQDIIKNRHLQQLREFKRFEKREKQLGVKFKCDSITKGFKNFEKVEIIGEEI